MASVSNNLSVSITMTGGVLSVNVRLDNSGSHSFFFRFNWPENSRTMKKLSQICQTVIKKLLKSFAQHCALIAVCWELGT